MEATPTNNNCSNCAIQDCPSQLVCGVLQAALATAALQQQRQLAGAGEAAPQAAPEQSMTPDGFKVPLPKKLSGNHPSASLQQDNVLTTEQPGSCSVPGMPSLPFCFFHHPRYQMLICLSLFQEVVARAMSVEVA